ncbi:hypothetical protein [Cyanobium gracile]|uniref:Ribbon-helix-helix protein, copG family n=1 Tax=Cyanobium gracile (strain ATCC 27147 / PCC 6307) TaxID=292564 RepID=K9P4G3_CYAGP|nr:hypothetical protein [Cyanobium gracile]AFY28302.1 hypothetical protein Cyagr_1123 [Cyanobium gracile PCC 6307]
MRTTLELPDPLFARLKAHAASRRLTLKQLLRAYVEQGLDGEPPAQRPPRSGATLPRLEGSLPIPDEQLSNSGLFSLMEP